MDLARDSRSRAVGLAAHQRLSLVLFFSYLRRRSPTIRKMTGCDHGTSDACTSPMIECIVSGRTNEANVNREPAQFAGVGAGCRSAFLARTLFPRRSLPICLLTC